MSKYKLIEAMGLKVYNEAVQHKWPDVAEPNEPRYMVSADELERVLEQAMIVRMGVDGDKWTFDQARNPHDTHTARLICIQPIKAPDTAESLLREFVEMYDGVPQNPITRVIYERARKLLEPK